MITKNGSFRGNKLTKKVVLGFPIEECFLTKEEAKEAIDNG